MAWNIQSTKQSENSKLGAAFNIIMKVNFSKWEDRTYFIY